MIKQVHSAYAKELAAGVFGMAWVMLTRCAWLRRTEQPARFAKNAFRNYLVLYMRSVLIT